MWRFKKVIFFLFFVLLLCCCFKEKKSPYTRKARLKILSTIAQVEDLVGFIGGDRIDSLVLIQAGLDPHSYEIVRGDLRKIEEADFLFYNGLGLEHGASLWAILERHPKALGIGEEIRKEAPERILEKDGAIDPHVWMDASLWAKGIASIVDTLSALDPEGEKEYRRKGEKLVLEMERLDVEIREGFQSIPEEARYLVTSHDAFGYFTKRYLAEDGEKSWMSRLQAPEGLAPEGQLSGRDIKKILAFLNKRKKAALFTEANVNKDAILKIANLGKKMGLLVRVAKESLYGDSMGKLTYVEMMRSNARVMQKYMEESWAVR